MTYVAPLPRDAITDPEMLDLIEQSEALGVPDDLFPLLVARAPEQAKPFMRALLMSHTEGNIDHRLKEIIRVLLARFAGDRYFSELRSRKAREMGLDNERIEAGCGDYEDSPLFTEAERWALRYADQMYLDSTKVDAAFYGELKKHYTEPQIMELGSFIAFHYGMQMFMRALGAAAPSNPVEDRMPCANSPASAPVRREQDRR
jgi:alkylhydroperoxidase family enzyme